MKRTKIKYRPVFFSIIFGTLLLHSCKKEEFTSWDTAVLAPLAESTLGIDNLLADSLLDKSQTDGVHLKFSRLLSLIDTDSLFKIPDTAFVESYKSPFFFPIKLMAGAKLDSIDNLVKFDFSNSRITELMIESGQSVLTLKNYITDIVLFDFTVPKATLNGKSLIHKDLKADTGTIQKPSEINVITDLKGYKFDLKGDNQSQFNRLRGKITARLNPQGSGAIIPPNQNLITYSNEFKGLVPYYARGYLGQPVFSAGDSITSEVFSRLNGNINLKDVKMQLSIENGIGADFSLELKKLVAIKTSSGKNLQLNHEICRSVQTINRAIETPGEVNPFKPYHKSYVLNASNSNVTDFFELLPDKITYDANILVNPLGDISSGNDFIYKTSNIKIKFNLDIPLNLSLSNLSLYDTITTNGIASSSSESIQSGEIRVLAENGFPFDMNIQVKLLDEQRNTLDEFFTQDIIEAAPVNTNSEVIVPKKTTLKLPFNNILRSKLSATRYIVVKANLNSQPPNQLLPILSSYKLKLKLIGSGIFRIILK